jgi:acetyltransferase-like isoleucine patch superfamily enzyme
MAGVVVNPNAPQPIGVQISPDARLAGAVTCREVALIGTGAVIIQGIEIGARAVVGPGAVVSRNVLADSTVAGNPARPVGSIG